MGSKLLWVVIAAVLIVVIGPRLNSGKPPATSSTPRPVATVDAWEPPAGFKSTTVDGVAAQWLDNPDCEYESADACWGIALIARDGCDALYVEVTIMDASGAVIDWSNDTAFGVRPGERALLSFESFEDTAQKARLEEVNCR